MIRRPPRSTPLYSSAASDVYKRQPKINEVKGFIEKCHFCTERTTDGIEPACVTACPTGALRMTQLDEFPSADIEWFPETDIRPSLRLRGTEKRSGPLIIPVDDPGPDEEESIPSVFTTKVLKEWSLLIFSLLLTAASALIIAYAPVSYTHLTLPTNREV